MDRRKVFIFYLFCLLFFLPILHGTQKDFILMIDPLGDAGNAGRIIDGCFERGLTLQYAEELKQFFKKKAPHIQTMLTRFPGETLEPLQKANFANRLKTDLYLNIQFYFQEHDSSFLTIYYYIQQPAEMWAKKVSKHLEFIPYDQAHCLYVKQTDAWATVVAKELEKLSYSHHFMFKGVYSCPIKPLVGIHGPSMSIEIGLKHRDDWKRFVEPLGECINNLIMYISGQ